MVLLLSVPLLSFLKYVVDQRAEALPEILQLIVYTSLPIAGGLTTLSFCSLLGTFAIVENSATCHLLKRTSEDPARNFSIGFLMTAYLSLIRPPLALNLPSLPYVEWVAIASAVYVMYTMTRLSTEEFYVGSGGVGWREHVQKVSRETGHDLIRITSVMEQFIDNGVKEPLLIYLTLHLQRLGETEEDILKTLSPLIDYKENAQRHRLHFLAFPWTKRKLALRNKEAREDVLKTLVKKIDRL